MHSRKSAARSLVAAVVFTSGMAWAQNANTGELKGTVTDASGALLPNATVTVTDQQTGVSTVAHTNNSGIYDEPSLPVGRYNLTFSLAGFHDYVRQGVDLQLGTYGIDAKLEVGASNEQVTVEANAPQVETESSEQSVNFDAKTVQDVPTVGGVWYNEITMALPGVNAGGGGAQSASGQGVGVNGTQGYLGTWLLEGSNATEPRDQNASNNYPPIDAIGEVNVQISNYGAQYGAGVAQFNVILKSGTNKFHGSLFEFNQNDAYNAKNYFQGSGQSAPLRWNEFGGSVGGPILRDKLFFYFTYQRNPEHSSAIAITTVPTQAMRDGDFSAFDATVYDPSTTACTGSAVGTCTRGAFTGNMIPSTSIDPVAAKIQSYFPLPNQPGLANNYKVSVTTPGLSQWYIGKIEYDISPKNRLSGSIFEFPTTLVNSVDAFCAEGFDCTYTSPRNLNQHAQISDLWTISTSTLNEVHVGAVRESDVYVPKTYGKGFPTTIGLEPAYGANAPGDIFPNVTVNAGGGAGGIGLGGGTHAKLADGTYDVSDVLTLVRGRHTLKVGGEYDRSYQNYTNWADVSSGNFQFNGIATENPSGTDPKTGTASLGVPYADFLLGQVYGWYLYDYAETGARTWNLGGFFQDDFKLLPNLTLNLGVRYNWQSGWSEVQNRWGTFDPNAVNTGQYVSTGTRGAIVYGGQNGRNTIQNGVSEVAPRIGLSYAPKPGLAIRASYGIFDAPRSAETYTDNALGLGLNPRGSEGYGSFPAFQLQNGPGPGAVVYPSESNLSNSQFNYQAVDYYPTHMPIQYYQEALLSIQKDLPYQVLFDTTYVFTKGTHLNFGRDINQVPESQLATGYNAMPYTQYSSILGHLFDGYSNYNALQLRVEKRPQHGVSLGFNYAYSKTMDSGTSNGHNLSVDVWQNANDVAANYGLSQLDATHTTNGWATYELPFGAGRSFHLHGILDEAFGGWRTTGVFQVHSGIPFTPTVGTEDESNSQAAVCSCGFAWYPNVIHNPKLSHPTINQWFDPTAFVTPAFATFGDERRNSLRGPNWRELDLSVGKTFAIREQMHLEVRADAFNAFNHPNFYQPNSGVGTGVGGAGAITTANTARQMQLGARYTF